MHNRNVQLLALGILLCFGTAQDDCEAPPPSIQEVAFITGDEYIAAYSDGLIEHAFAVGANAGYDTVALYELNGEDSRVLNRIVFPSSYRCVGTATGPLTVLVACSYHDSIYKVDFSTESIEEIPLPEELNLVIRNIHYTGIGEDFVAVGYNNPNSFDDIPDGTSYLVTNDEYIPLTQDNLFCGENVSTIPDGRLSVTCNEGKHFVVDLATLEYEDWLPEDITLSPSLSGTMLGDVYYHTCYQEGNSSSRMCTVESDGDFNFESYSFYGDLEASLIDDRDVFNLYGNDLKWGFVQDDGVIQQYGEALNTRGCAQRLLVTHSHVLTAGYSSQYLNSCSGIFSYEGSASSAVQ